MTEQEWDRASDPDQMDLALLELGPSTRGLRLLSCACCRRMLRLKNDPWFLDGIEFLERLADGEADVEQLPGWIQRASQAAEEAEDLPSNDPRKVVREGASNALAFALDNDHVTCMEWASHGLDVDRELRAHADLFREIFGNPFRAVEFDSRWRTSAVVELANRIYEQRSFQLLPTLGHELARAGCDNDETLRHCRDKEGHVRGCWVVDLILNKE